MSSQQLNNNDGIDRLCRQQDRTRENVLGEGKYGIVYHVNYDGKQLALKILKTRTEENQVKAKEELRNASIMKVISEHKNLLKIQ